MSEHSLLHLVRPSPHLPARSGRARWSFAVALAAHAAAATLLAVAAVRAPRAPVPPPASASASEKPEIPRLVFLQVPGPGGGGGGGGNRQSAPPSRAQAVGHDRMTLRIARPPVPRQTPIESEPAPAVVLQAVPLTSGVSALPGMPEAPASLPFSLGPGSGGGAGEGTGTGLGSGRGPGVGPGSGGGFGGNAYRPGNGVTAPTLLKQVRPFYTSEAMQRRIQGTVVLEAVVTRDGVPTEIRVVRSLDAYGLDAEAIRAAGQWRFAPGRIGSTPVDVLVNIVIDFRIN